jgi:segregation and condensation protein A
MTTKTNAFGVPTYQYQISLPGFDFEGPLDLLLQLIERNELPITEIALANIADEYVAYVNRLSEVNPAEIAEFLVIAAKLLYIKSQALLPAPPARSGDAVDAATAAEELIAQLREYKQIKEAAQFLRERQEGGMRSYPTRRVGLNETMSDGVNEALQKLSGRSLANAGLAHLKLSDLLALVKRRLAAQQQQQLKLPLPATAHDMRQLVRSVKIEDKIALVEARLDDIEAARLQNRPAASAVEFTSLFDAQNPPGSIEVIVTFMAILELLRRRVVEVSQHELFGEIYVNRPPTLFSPVAIEQEQENGNE